MELDIWGYVAKYIKHNNDKCRLMMTCKWISECEFWFTEPIEIEKITELKWFDHFCSIYARKKIKLPKLTNYLIILFNEPVNDYVPSTVIHLEFHESFNQPIDGCIPLSVTHLSFFGNFNQPINECISSSVTHLSFYGIFNQPINRCIPSSVIFMELGNSCDQSISNIPSSVTHLRLHGKGRYIPTSVTHLHLYKKPIQIPTSIQYLSIRKNYPDVIFPSSITNLTLNYQFFSGGSKIPLSVTHLQFGINRTGKMRSDIFTYKFAKKLIPSSVKYLTFGNTFDLPIENCIPSTVTHLTFSKYFTQSIKNNIPTSVVQITFLAKRKYLRDDIREYASKNNIEIVFNY